MTTRTDVAPAEPTGSAPDRFKTPLIIKLLVASTFVVILNETIMINAIPRLMVDFDVSPRSAQWLSSIFMLTMAAVIPITGWFLQRVTTRSAYTVAMTTFMVGTLLAALAPTFEVLLVARSIQAAGTAVMMPLLMTTLMQVVPENERGRVMGDVMLAISVAPAFGPVLSGLILNVGSWRLIFLFVLPVAALITAFGLRQLKNVGEIQTGRVSWLSVALAGGGFATLVYGLSEVGARSGGQLTTIISVGVGAGGRVRRLPAAPAEVGQPADGPACAQVAHLHDHAAADVGRVHGLHRLDDPAAAVPAGHPAPVGHADRRAGHARRHRDGPARPAGRCTCTTGSAHDRSSSPARSSWSAPWARSAGWTPTRRSG